MFPEESIDTVIIRIESLTVACTFHPADLVELDEGVVGAPWPDARRGIAEGIPGIGDAGLQEISVLAASRVRVPSSAQLPLPGPASYPGKPSSEAVCAPALNSIGVSLGTTTPSMRRPNSSGSVTVPVLSLMMVLTSLNVGAMSLFVSVQVAVSPGSRVTLSPSTWVPPTQTQSEAW